jgi:hypothetical protein
MSDDPYVREIGRLEDGQGRIVIVGVSYDAVTLQAVHPAGEAVELGGSQTEELAQLVVSAAWQAAWQTGASLSAIRVEQAPAGAP